MPEITVIMPVHNKEKTLAKAIESILGQSYEEFEFIIIDDGSTDRTKNILEYYHERDRRIVLFSLPQRRGLAYALNYALKFAKGKYIVRQDADDKSFPKRIEKQLQFLKRNNLDFVFSYTYLVNEKGRILKIERSPTEHSEIVATLEKYNCLGHPTAMFKKEALTSLGGYNEYFELAQDYDLYLRGILKGLKFGVLPKPLVQRGFSDTQRSIDKRRRQIFYALSAQTSYFAKKDKFSLRYVFYIINHLLKLLIPPVAREIRTRLYQAK
jgi:glycosyltransferase involved in cell wall biosynthesis